MPIKVPTNQVHLMRPTGKKDAKGNPMFTRHVVPPHQPFEFTAAEIAECKKTSPTLLRDPKNESADVQLAIDPDDIGGGAPGDAAVTAAEVEKNTKTAGKNKQAGKGSETGNPITVPEEEDEEM